MNLFDDYSVYTFWTQDEPDKASKSRLFSELLQEAQGASLYLKQSLTQPVT